MSLTGTIRRPNRDPLGTVEEVEHHLSDAFPGVQFSYHAQEPPGLAALGLRLPLMLRLWLLAFVVKTRYPCYYGLFKRDNGGTVEFHFEAQEPVRWVKATLYGMTGGLDANFDRLFAATGWITVYPRF
jgi:hypothetical protein